MHFRGDKIRHMKSKIDQVFSHSAVYPKQVQGFYNNVSCTKRQPVQIQLLCNRWVFIHLCVYLVHLNPMSYKFINPYFKIFWLGFLLSWYNSWWVPLMNVWRLKCKRVRQKWRVGDTVSKSDSDQMSALWHISSWIKMEWVVTSSNQINLKMISHCLYEMVVELWKHRNKRK